MTEGPTADPCHLKMSSEGVPTPPVGDNSRNTDGPLGTVLDAPESATPVSPEHRCVFPADETAATTLTLTVTYPAIDHQR